MPPVTLYVLTSGATLGALLLASVRTLQRKGADSDSGSPSQDAHIFVSIAN